MPDDRIKVLQNLKDADCNAELISQFFRMEEAGKVSEQLRLLYRQRKILLERLHLNQKQIDCLDYLIFCINQNC